VTPLEEELKDQFERDPADGKKPPGPPHLGQSFRFGNQGVAIHQP